MTQKAMLSQPMAMPPSNRACSTAWAVLTIIPGPKPQRTQYKMMGNILRSIEPPQGNLYRGKKLRISASAIQIAPSVSRRTRRWVLLCMKIPPIKNIALQPSKVQCDP